MFLPHHLPHGHLCHRSFSDDLAEMCKSIWQLVGVLQPDTDTDTDKDTERERQVNLGNPLILDLWMEYFPHA